MVPVARQIALPTALLGAMAVAGVVAALVRRPDLSPWWRIAVAVALFLLPLAATAWALAPARKLWKSAAAAPMWATEETGTGTLMRFKWAIGITVVLIVAGVLTHTMPGLGLAALGSMAAFAHHLGRALGWQSANGRRLFNESAVAANPQVARAYWQPRG